jgi:ABC-type transport system substrate-binding protein
MHDYWSTFSSRRLTRRRSLALMGGATAGAALLAACGGSSGDGASKQASDLVTAAKDESKAAIKGGVFKGVSPLNLLQIDPHQPGGHIGVVRRVYSQLFRVKDGYLAQANGDIEGDLAESWELSPDKLTLTMKLNPNAHWAPVAPTNGRSVTVQDVIYTWDRFRRSASRRSELVNDVNPYAPIISLAAPDERTIVIKFKEPNATIFTALGSNAVGTMYMLPAESADDKVLDVRRQALGSGPFYLASSIDTQNVYKRNPGFHGGKGELPYLDEIDDVALFEYAAGLAQFRAGAVYTYGSLRGEDIVPTKRDLPELELRKNVLSSTSGVRWFFGQLPDSPFKDPRVRQAFVMTWDRDAFIDAMYNASSFKSQGLEVETVWDTAITGASWAGWWLDPKSKEFGPNARYFQKNEAEARKLLDAAGFTKAVDFDLHQIQVGPGAPPQSFFVHSEVITGMVRDSGLFNPKLDLVNYTTAWTPQYRNIRGQFSGVAWWPDTTPTDPTAAVYAAYNSKGGSLFQGSDTTLDDLTARAVAEFDTPKRASLVKQVQQHEAATMFQPKIGGANSFNLAWPVVRNQNVWQGGTNHEFARIFLDPSKAPLKRSNAWPP